MREGNHSPHGRFDGTGYPDRLAGDQIPLDARIVAAADAYSVMITDRPFRAAVAPDTAIDELRRCAGSQFDPTVVAALVDELHAAASVGTAGPAIATSVRGVRSTV